jgi:hypothetical protein
LLIYHHKKLTFMIVMRNSMVEFGGVAEYGSNRAGTSSLREGEITKILNHAQFLKLLKPIEERFSMDRNRLRDTLVYVSYKLRRDKNKLFDRPKLEYGRANTVFYRQRDVEICIAAVDGKLARHADQLEINSANRNLSFEMWFIAVVAVFLLSFHTFIKFTY